MLTHGTPLAFYSDRHGIFRVNAKDAESGDGKTEFGRVADRLEIEPIHALTPQAKGRVERANQTLRDRRGKELRGVATMAAASGAAEALAALYRAARRLGSVAGSAGAVTGFGTTPVDFSTTPSGVTCRPGASTGGCPQFHRRSSRRHEDSIFPVGRGRRRRRAGPEASGPRTNPRYGGAAACRSFRRPKGTFNFLLASASDLLTRIRNAG